MHHTDIISLSSSPPDRKLPPMYDMPWDPSKNIESSKGLGLFWTPSQNILGRLDLNLWDSRVAFNMFSNMASKSNLTLQIQQYLDDSLQIYDKRYNTIISNLDEIERELDKKLDEYYTRYVRMPYMGNYSYLDPLNPLSLH